MIQFLLWYCLLTLIGLIAFPIIYRILPFLADKGYAFSRIFGFLIWSYLFWITSCFGITPNNKYGAFFILTIFVVLVFVTFQKLNRPQFWQWIQINKKLIIIVEVLFFSAFVTWTVVRAANPDISGTEKPMELAFINSIIRSPSFPPNDPWLSGYSISYYYFGYLMVTLLGYITGTPPSISFNLAISAWFALTAVACYGIVYNLLRTWQDKNGIIKHIRKKESSRFIFSSLLGPFFVLIVSNAEGFLEILHSRGFFWKIGSDGTLQSKFWNWLNIQELNEPPSRPFGWIPQRLGGIWWWRASRVLQDFNLAGVGKEIIDEFPFFSYLLGDLHPHVLAMPFVLLLVAVGLNIFRGVREKSFLTISMQKWIKNPFLLFLSLACGGIAFLNTWDLPIMLGLLVFIFLYSQVRQSGLNKYSLIETIKFLVLLILFSFILYIPFFLGFSSQAGGILPSIEFFTRGIHFWVMFLPFLVTIFCYLLWLLSKYRDQIIYSEGIKISLLVVGILFLFSLSITLLIINAPLILKPIQKVLSVDLQKTSDSINNLQYQFLSLHGSENSTSLILSSFRNLLLSPVTLITLVFMLFLTLSFLSSTFKTKIPIRKFNKYKNTEELNNHFPILLLILLGTGLCIIPEFIYLRDVFGTRMNTIFKFYFQTWIIWGIASAAGIVIFWNKIENRFRNNAFRYLSIIGLLFCLIYPFFAIGTKTNNFNPGNWTLDGNDYLKRSNSDEYQAIKWLSNASFGVIAEAVGGSYSGSARISSLTGLPTVLGWPGHELQWRGGMNEMGSREGDIETLYTTRDWITAQSILSKYHIRYIYIGNLERARYILDENKFQQNMALVFNNASVSVYRFY